MTERDTKLERTTVNERENKMNGMIVEKNGLLFIKTDFGFLFTGVLENQYPEIVGKQVNHIGNGIYAIEDSYILIKSEI